MQVRSVNEELMSPKTTPIKPPLSPVAKAAKPQQKTLIVEPDAHLWAEARRTNKRVKISLIDGDVISGLVVAWGNYSVTIDTDEPSERRRVIFKHGMLKAWISTISA
jgi:sRNA-binding regulator protein Hfq